MTHCRLVTVVSLAVVLSLTVGCLPEKAQPQPQSPNDPLAEQAPPVSQPEPAPQPIATPQPQPQELPAISLPAAIAVDQFNISLSNIFKSVVDGDGLVDYAKLRRMKIELNTAIKKFADFETDEYTQWPLKTQTAFWINAYNLFTMKIVSDNFPIKESRYKLVFYPSGPKHISGLWTKHYLTVMQIQYTLSEIERKIIEISNDPRIHFALSFANLSGATLRNEPYMGIVLNEQLDDQAKTFLAKSGHYAIDTKNKQILLSKVFARETADFLKKYNTNKIMRQYPPDERAILNCIINYIPSDDVNFIKKNKCVIEYTKDDWQLNAQKTR